MEKKKATVPLVCHGHSRPVVDLFYSPVTPDGFFLISASKGMIFFLSIFCDFVCAICFLVSYFMDLILMWKNTID